MSVWMEGPANRCCQCKGWCSQSLASIHELLNMFHNELLRTHSERSTRFLCVDFRSIDEPRQLERHDRI